MAANNNQPPYPYNTDLLPEDLKQPPPEGSSNQVMREYHHRVAEYFSRAKEESVRIQEQLDRVYDECLSLCYKAQFALAEAAIARDASAAELEEEFNRLQELRGLAAEEWTGTQEELENFGYYEFNNKRNN